MPTSTNCPQILDLILQSGYLGAVSCGPTSSMLLTGGDIFFPSLAGLAYVTPLVRQGGTWVEYVS